MREKRTEIKEIKRTTEIYDVNIFLQLHLRVDSSKKKKKKEWQLGIKFVIDQEMELTLSVLSYFDLSVFQGKLNKLALVWILLWLVIHLSWPGKDYTEEIQTNCTKGHAHIGLILWDHNAIK